MPRAGWFALVLVSVATATPAGAQPLPPAAPLDPIAPLAPIAPDSVPQFSSTPIARSPNTDGDRPPKVLGAPVAVGDFAPRPAPAPAPAVKPVAYQDTPAQPVERRSQRAAGFGVPSAAESAFGPASTTPAAPVAAAMIDEAVARTAYQPSVGSSETDLNDFLTKRSELREQRERKDREAVAGGKFERSSGRFGEGISDTLGNMFGTNNGGWFRSDHIFDGFISPVSNPFLFEDPRSLTEVRPIFIYQKVPSGQLDFRGGNVTFFGAQGRVAITDRWSFVFHKFGGISVNPNSALFPDTTSFAELWLGPKWTFYRGEDNCTLAAAGLQFQIPTGSRGAFQDTGSLSLAPYVSYATNFLRDFSYGSFNFMANTGYSFGTDNKRSDFYWLSAHIDMDVQNNHKFYPLFELNWLVNTSNGSARPIGAEGRDLINFGGQAKTGLLTGAFGARYKITENAQVGGAFEFPFAGRKDLFQYRFTLDFILRY